MVDRFKPRLTGFNAGLPSLSSAEQREAGRLFSNLSASFQGLSEKAFRLQEERAKILGEQRGVDKAQELIQEGATAEEFTEQLPDRTGVFNKAFREAASLRFVSETNKSFHNSISLAREQHGNNPNEFLKQANAIQRGLINGSPPEVKNNVADITSRKIASEFNAVLKISSNAARQDAKDLFTDIVKDSKSRAIQALLEDDSDSYELSIAEIDQAYEDSIGSIFSQDVAALRRNKDILEITESAVFSKAAISDNPVQVIIDNGLFTPENLSKAVTFSNQFQSIQSARENREKQRQKRERDAQTNEFYIEAIRNPDGIDPSSIREFQAKIIESGANSTEAEQFGERVFNAITQRAVRTAPHVEREVHRLYAEGDSSIADYINDKAGLISPEDYLRFDKLVRNRASDVINQPRVKNKLKQFYRDQGKVLFSRQTISANPDVKEQLQKHDAQAAEFQADIEADLLEAFDSGEVTVSTIEEFLNQRVIQNPDGSQGFSANLTKSLFGDDAIKSIRIRDVFSGKFTVPGQRRNINNGRNEPVIITVPELNRNNIREVVSSMREALSLNPGGVPFTMEDIVLIEQYARDSE